MYIASTSTNIKIHDFESGTLQFTHGNQKQTLKGVKWSNDGKYLLQIGNGTELDILTITDDRLRTVQQVSIEQPTAAAFQRSSIRNVAVGCRSGKTFIWDVKLKNIVKKFPPSSSAVKFLDFNVKNTFLAAALESGEINLYNVITNALVGTVKVQRSKTVSSLAFHKDLRSVLGIATEEGSILLRDLDLGKDRMFLEAAHAAPVSGIAFSPINKDVMISCSFDKKVLIHDIRLKSVVSTINTEKFFTSVDMNAAGFIVLGSNSGEVLVYNLRDFIKPVYTFDDHKSSVSSVAFQPVVDRYNKNSICNISLKESYSPKSTLVEGNTSFNKTLDSASFCNLINKTCSPMNVDSPSSIKETEVDGSNDSFLLNILENTNISSMTNLNDQKQLIGIPNNKSLGFMNTSRLKNISQFSPDVNDRVNSINGTISTSTPVLTKNLTSDNPTPSPIEKNSDVNGNNSDYKKVYSLSKKKSLDSPTCPSEVETVVCNKCNQNMASNLNADMKNYIRYSLFDLEDRCRTNHCQMTIHLVKTKLSLEDQIQLVIQKMEIMQQSLNSLLEENKKLSIEMEMIRSAKK